MAEFVSGWALAVLLFCALFSAVLFVASRKARHGFTGFGGRLADLTHYLECFAQELGELRHGIADTVSAAFVEKRLKALERESAQKEVAVVKKRVAVVKKHERLRGR